MAHRLKIPVSELVRRAVRELDRIERSVGEELYNKGFEEAIWLIS